MDCEIQLLFENVYRSYAQQKKEWNYQNFFVFNGSFIWPYKYILYGRIDGREASWHHHQNGRRKDESSPGVFARRHLFWEFHKFCCLSSKVILKGRSRSVFSFFVIFASTNLVQQERYVLLETYWRLADYVIKFKQSTKNHLENVFIRLYHIV